MPQRLPVIRRAPARLSAEQQAHLDEIGRLQAEGHARRAQAARQRAADAEARAARELEVGALVDRMEGRVRPVVEG